MKDYRAEDIKDSIVAEFVGNNSEESPDTLLKSVEGTDFMLSLEDLKESMEKFAEEIQSAVNVPKEIPKQMPKEKVTVSVRIDKDIKEQFERVCHSIGLNISDAINIFVRKVVSEQAIPFEVKLKKESGGEAL